MSWKNIYHRCYCAFCKTERKVCTKKHVNTVNILYSFLGGFALMFLFWQSFDPRVLVLVALTLGLSEVFIQMRWRLSMSCSHCGFDPVLYAKTPDLAAQKVKVHLDQRQSDPHFLLKPRLNLPVMVKRSVKDLMLPPVDENSPTELQ